MLEINVDFDRIRDLFSDLVCHAEDLGFEVIQFVEDGLIDLNNTLEAL